jgi:hypothetical protein
LVGVIVDNVLVMGAPRLSHTGLETFVATCTWNGPGEPVQVSRMFAPWSVMETRIGGGVMTAKPTAGETALELVP